MGNLIEYLREFNLLSAALRLMLAAAGGGIIGYGRARKQRNAGLRTYMLVSLGAALTMLISLYEYEMLQTQWAWLHETVDVKFDGTRYAAQVISGIGFLAAGTIIAVAHQQVSGLTSAIGLIAAGAIGIASGAGFYEIVLIGLFLLMLSMEVLQPVELTFKRRLRNLTICVQYEAPEDIGKVSEVIGQHGARMFDLDIEDPEKTGSEYPSAIIVMRLSKVEGSHSAMLSSVAELDCVRSVRELIS